MTRLRDLSQNDKIQIQVSQRICCSHQDNSNTAFDRVLFKLRFSLGLIYAAKLYYCWSTWLKAATQAAVDHWCALLFPNSVFGKKKLLETELKEDLYWRRKEKTVSYHRFQTNNLYFDFNRQSLADPPSVSQHKNQQRWYRSCACSQRGIYLLEQEKNPSFVSQKEDTTSFTLQY